MFKVNKALSLLLILSGLFLYSCQKDNVSIDAYVPTAADATANASLEQLQHGRKLFINNCGACHGLPSPDDYTPTDWSSILGIMSRRAGLSESDASLVYKYLSRGQ